MTDFDPTAMFWKNPMGSLISLLGQNSPKFPSLPRVELPFHSSPAHLFPHTRPRFEAESRSDRSERGGREVKFLAVT